MVGGGYSMMTQLYNTGQVSWSDVVVDASIGTIAGGVFGLTLGIGNVAIGSAGLVGGKAMMAKFGTLAVAGISGGRTDVMLKNMVGGVSLTQNLFNKQDMMIDVLEAEIGGQVKTGSEPVNALFGSLVGKGVESVGESFIESNVCQKRIHVFLSIDSEQAESNLENERGDEMDE